MRPELQRLHDQLTEVRADIANVDDTARIATNGWTVSQVLDHLAKVHEALVPRFNAALDAAPDRQGDEAVRYSFLDRQLVKALSGRSFKLPVPSMFQPGESVADAKGACLASTDALLAVLCRADGKALTGLRIKPPITNRVSISVMPYLDALVQHARYHRGQI